MASTYSSQLRLEKPANGDYVGSWQNPVNNTYELIEDAICGLATVPVTGGAYSLTAVNGTYGGSTDEARCAFLKFTGTLTSNSIVTIPSVAKAYIVWNATSGAFTLSLKTAAGAALAITQGTKAVVFCDGSSTFLIVTDIAAGGGTTGSGASVLASSPTIITPTISGILTTAGQIAFPAAQNPSADANTLDDYEENIWTPIPGAVSGTASLVTASGTYTKIGRLVHCDAYITFSSGTLSGDIRISGFPFTPATTPVGVIAVAVQASNFASQVRAASLNVSGPYINLYDNSANKLQGSDAGASNAALSFTYRV